MDIRPPATPEEQAGLEERLAREAEAREADERARIRTVVIGSVAGLSVLVATFGAVVAILAEDGANPNALKIALGATLVALFAVGKITWEQIASKVPGK